MVEACGPEDWLGAEEDGMGGVDECQE